MCAIIVGKYIFIELESLLYKVPKYYFQGKYVIFSGIKNYRYNYYDLKTILAKHKNIHQCVSKINTILPCHDV